MERVPDLIVPAHGAVAQCEWAWLGRLPEREHLHWRGRPIRSVQLCGGAVMFELLIASALFVIAFAIGALIMQTVE
jgi:hypothetical protein